MKIFFHRHFGKQYRKFPQSIKKRFKDQLTLFEQDPFDPVLHNHALAGSLNGYRSINISGDIRAIYKTLAENDVEFVFIGTHHELYGT